MKKLLVVFVISLFVSAVRINASVIPFPGPGHEGLNTSHAGNIGDLKLGLWLQYRVMYNNSTIPGPTGTSFTNTKRYDFFRQRFRVGIDVKTAEDTGGYVQLEYRGGWGGSSPEKSDPRELTPVNNPYNRLQSRGIRYGFIYAPVYEIGILSAGIIPLTDRVGRVLFDADWDFNVGGAVLGGFIGEGDYRLGYVRLVEGVGGAADQIENDGDMVIADYDYSFSEAVHAGVHVYNYSASDALGVTASKNETWYAFTVKGKNDIVDIGGNIIVNIGNIGSNSHKGTAAKLEAGVPIGALKLNVMAITATGDEQGKVDGRFVTVHQLVGTVGYWGYTHIFNAGGPSDVNDLGLEIGNGGAGLTTVQVKIDIPVTSKISASLFGGWFSSAEKRNNSKDMGMEAGCVIGIPVSKDVTWEIGGSGASIGEFYAKNADNISEYFSRLQLTW